MIKNNGYFQLWGLSGQVKSGGKTFSGKVVYGRALLDFDSREGLND